MLNNNLQEQIFHYLLNSPDGVECAVREIDLARHFGVSVTPVREALNNLEEKGFVERRKKKGTFLKSFSLKEINEIYDIRSIMEGLAARLLSVTHNREIIKNLRKINSEYIKHRPGRKKSVLAPIDYKFHMLIVESSQNMRLKNLIRDLHLITKTLKQKSSSEGYLQKGEVNPYAHSDIIDAIESGSPIRAEDIARRHVEWTKDNIIKKAILQGKIS